MRKVNILLAVIVVLIAVVFMLLSTGAMKGLQSGLLSLMSPFLKTGSAVQQGLGAMGKGFKSLDELEADNRRLDTENKELRATNQILRDMEAENNRLRSALDYRERSLFRLVPAQIFSRDASSWWNTVLINRGFEDGVDDGLGSGVPMTVITDKGLLVGKVMNVQKNSATVLLITDENCRIGAYVEGSRSKGIVSGMRVQEGGNPELQMNFLDKNANLEPGQKVYTQGGAVFPPGLPIGTVKSFEARELDGQAIITPEVDFSTLADVFVIVGSNPEP